MLKRLLLLIFLIPIFSYSQSGKIVGLLTDKDTGEPLAGANVILENTVQGATSDADGYYVILNINAGTYSIRASYIGYKDVLAENVYVSSGVTTNQNFELQQSAIELDEAVIITAERPLVEKNVTQSYSLITADNIKSIPVRGLNNLIALQTSVVVQDGSVHIRGGRANEVGFYLDGVSTINPYTNTSDLFVIPEAIEEIQVLTGGYQAEHGSANSGMVRTQLKSGSDRFNASFDIQSDNFASEGEKFLGTYSYHHTIAVGSFSGPITDKIKFFVAAEKNYQGDDEVRFSDGWEFSNILDQETAAQAANDPDVDSTFVSVAYPDGYTPYNQRERYSANGTLMFDYNPVSVKLSGSWTTQRQWSPQYTVGKEYVPWLNAVRDRSLYDDLDSYLFSAKITHALSSNSFYAVTLGAYSHKLELGDEYFGNNWQAWYDSSKQSSRGAFKDAWEDENPYNLNGIPFNRKGQPFAQYRKEDQSYLSAALDFTTQYGRYHEIKFGGDAKLYTVRRFRILPSVMKYAADTTYGNRIGTETFGGIENVPPEFWMIQGGVNAFGYDIYGNEIDSDKHYSYTDEKGNETHPFVQGPKQPIYGSAYIQDKIEYKDLIINAGLRLDYFDTDDQTLDNIEDVLREPESNQILQSEWKSIDPHILLSPRLGFSFPVSETAVFYFQYGKFAQMPHLSRMYFGTQRLSRQILFGGNYYPGPIGFDLDPIKTTNYEVGFRKQVSNFAAFDVTGFYRNVKGQIQVIKQPVASTATIQAYDRYVNGDFATTSGLEFKLTLRRVNRIQAQFNYTLTDAEGTGSNSLSYRAAAYRGTTAPTITSPLDYEQKHRGSINIDYRFGENDGGPVFNNFGANALFSFNSGHPYTKVYVPPGGQVDPYNVMVDYMNDTRQRQALEPFGASTTPWNFTTDLNVDKSFRIGDLIVATAYMRVTNLFNKKNVINVYQKTGSAVDDGFLNDPTYSGSFISQNGPDYVDMYRAIAQGNGNAYRGEVGNELFGHPRQIFFGIRVTY